MPYVSLQDQGFYEPSRIIQDAANNLLVQKQLRQRVAQSAQQFPIEQQQRLADAQASTLRTGALPQQIQDEAQQRLLRNQGLTTENATRALQLQYETETDPLKKAQLAEELKGLVLKNTPTDSDTTSDVDANGNVTEKTTFTRGGQPAGSTSKVIRGNRPPRDGKMTPAYNTDPLTGEKSFAGSYNPETGAFTPAAAPASNTGDRITQSLVDKYYEPGADGKLIRKTGFFPWSGPVQPKNNTDAVALRKLRSDPDAVQKYGLSDALAPLSGNPGVATPPPATTAPALNSRQLAMGMGPDTQDAAQANPAPSAAPVPSTSPAPDEPSAPAVPTPKTQKAAPAAASGTSEGPKKFSDLKPGDVFSQGGKRYRKTGDRTAVPVQD